MQGADKVMFFEFVLRGELALKKNTLTGMRGQFQSAPHQGGKAINRIVKAPAYSESYSI